MNKVSNWAASEGIKSGDVVALVLDNNPEYVITWLGLAKLNIVASLVNPHLRGAPLKHSLLACSARHFIVSADHLHAVQEMRNAPEFSVFFSMILRVSF